MSIKTGMKSEKDFFKHFDFLVEIIEAIKNVKVNFFDQVLTSKNKNNNSYLFLDPSGGISKQRGLDE